MSQENVQNVRRTMDAWNRRDLDAVLRMAAADIEYVNSPRAVEAGTRVGRDEYASVLRAQWDFVGDARVKIESLQSCGDDVFVMLQMSRTLNDLPAFLTPSASARNPALQGANLAPTRT